MSEAQLKKVLLRAGIAFVLFFCLVPYVWMVVISLGDSPDFLARGGYELTARNYLEVVEVKSLHFLNYLRNSLVVCVLTALLSAMIGALAAYAVSRVSFPGKVLIVVGVLAVSMFPQISLVGYLYKLMSGLGWINSYQALVLPYIAWSVPLALWMLLSYFAQIPKELDEAALVDGAGRLQVLVRVILPVALPGFLATVVLVLIFSFNEFLFALMLTTDFTARTVPVGIALFEGLHGEIPWGQIMAASALASLPVILIALILQRYVVQGLTRGAVR